MSTSNPYDKDLIRYLLHADTPDDMTRALEFLLTPTEYQELNNRLRIAKRLTDGISQRVIAKELGVAIATVSRGARALKDSRHLNKEK